MSQPKRYSVAVDDPWFGNGAYIQEDGKYVLYSDYAALAAENEAMKSFLKWNGQQGAYQEWLDWRAERSNEGSDK